MDRYGYGIAFSTFHSPSWVLIAPYVAIFIFSHQSLGQAGPPTRIIVWLIRISNMVNRIAQKDLPVSCLGNSTIESLLGDTVVLYESVFRGDTGNLVWNHAEMVFLRPWIWMYILHKNFPYPSINQDNCYLESWFGQGVGGGMGFLAEGNHQFFLTKQ